MDKPRRLFLNQLSLMAGVAALSEPLTSIAAVNKYSSSKSQDQHTVTIYYTNDLHGKVSPVYDEKGGINCVNSILAKQEISGLLIDAGNFLNGTNSPAYQKHFISAMNNMGYQVAAPGYHEFANGQAHLAGLIPLMKFKLVNCNYVFEEKLDSLINKYLVVDAGKFKVGITGVGPKLNGIIYNDAIQCANSVCAFLKEKEKCDLVICLSQLPCDGNSNTPSNTELAEQSIHIDMIVGGSVRKLTMGPYIVQNKQKRAIILSQAAPKGLMLGKTTFRFDGDKQHHTISSKCFIPGRSNDQTNRIALSDLRSIEKHLAEV